MRHDAAAPSVRWHSENRETRTLVIGGVELSVVLVYVEANKDGVVFRICAKSVATILADWWSRPSLNLLHSVTLIMRRQVSAFH